MPEWAAAAGPDPDPDGGLNVSQAAAMFVGLASANSAALMTEQLGKARFILFSPSVGYVKGSAYNLWGALWHGLTGRGPPAQQQSFRQMALGSVVNPPLPIKATTEPQKQAYTDYIEGGCPDKLASLPLPKTGEQSNLMSAEIRTLALSDTLLINNVPVLGGDRRQHGNGYVYMDFGNTKELRIPDSDQLATGQQHRIKVNGASSSVGIPVQASKNKLADPGLVTHRLNEGSTVVEVKSKELYKLIKTACILKETLTGAQFLASVGKKPADEAVKTATVKTYQCGTRNEYAVAVNQPPFDVYIYPKADLESARKCERFRADAAPKLDAKKQAEAGVAACGYATDDEFKMSTVFRSIAWGVHDVVLPVAHALFVLACALLLRKRVLQLQVQPAPASSSTPTAGGWVGLAVGYVGAALCLRVFDVEGSWWYDPDLAVLALVLVSGVCYPFATDTALLSGAMLTMAFRALVPPDGNPYSMPLAATAVLAMWAWAVFSAAGSQQFINRRAAAARQLLLGIRTYPVKGGGGYGRFD